VATTNSNATIRALWSALAVVVLAICTSRLGNAQGRAQASIEVSATVVAVAPSLLAWREAGQVALKAVREPRATLGPFVEGRYSTVRAARLEPELVAVHVEFAGN
jgi:hypothetical protein